MKSIFDPVTLGGIASPNRLVRSAAFECPARNGGYSFVENLGPLYERLAEGGVGVIISGAVGVGPNSRALPSMIKAYGGGFVPEMRELARRVHAKDGKLVVQISHCGVKAGCLDTTKIPLGPSVYSVNEGIAGRPMDEWDIAAVVADFASAAALCREAGVDGVQIHAAHGYLLSQFLSPYFNKREDGYGGNAVNRARIVLEVYNAIRVAVGAEYPVWIKINGSDMVEGGLTPEDSLIACQELAAREIDAIEVSGCLVLDPKTSAARIVRTEADEGCFAPLALSLAERIAASVSVISVCGYRTPAVISRWLNKGGIAAISLCRGLISEPNLPNRWKNGDESKSRCISCNKCFRPKNGLRCVAFAPAV